MKKKVKPLEKNNKEGTAFIGTVSIFIGGLLLMFLINAILPFDKFDERRMPFELLFTISSFVSTLMLLLSVYLIFIYLKDYMELRSSFTLGLLLMLISLMLFAITSNPMLHKFLGVFGQFGIITIIPYVFATISLMILLKISLT